VWSSLGLAAMVARAGDNTLDDTVQVRESIGPTTPLVAVNVEHATAGLDMAQ
jgi:hypothetical protein